MSDVLTTEVGEASYGAIGQPLRTAGEPRQFASGAQRDADTGKARFDLLPVTALERVAAHYAKGAEKYGEDNWRRGIPRAEFLKSALRHVNYLRRGDTDEDHAAAAVWNLLGWIETCELSLDNLPEGSNWPQCGKCGRTFYNQCREPNVL